MKKGQKMSEELKRKISEAQKGKRRKPLTKEHKRKISMGNKGRKVSIETRRKIGAGNKGKKMTEEQKRKISESCKKSMTKKRREKIRKINTGKKHTKETKIKVSMHMQGITNIKNWDGFISSKKEIIRKSSRYIQWRNKVYKRDGWICQDCGDKGGELHAHHILFFAKHPKHRFLVKNGKTLCIKCHKAIHRKMRKTD